MHNNVILLAMIAVVSAACPRPEIAGRPCNADADCLGLLCVDGGCALTDDSRNAESVTDFDPQPITDYERWGLNEPDNVGVAEDADCAAIRLNSVSGVAEGEWHDANCFEPKAFVCAGAPPSACEAIDDELSLCTQRLSFADAANVCATTGGSLARIHGEEQHEVMLSFVDPRLDDDDVWIGAQDTAVEGTWRWADGDILPAPFSRWNAPASQPDGSSDGEDCAVMDDSGVWYDAPCDDTNAFICEGVTQAFESGCTIAVSDLIVCTQELTFDEAAETCARMGGALVRVDSAARNDTVLAARTAVGSDCWLGATDADNEDTWRWLDGSVFETL